MRRRARHRHADHLRRPAVREDARRRRKDLRDVQGQRASSAIEKAKDPTEKREALRKAIASTKNFEGINGKWSFDENGDVDYDTMSGFKAVKADGPIGCKFAFETILE